MQRNADDRPRIGPPRQARLVIELRAWVVLLCVVIGGCDLAQRGHNWDNYPSPIEALAARHEPLNPTLESQQRGRGIYEHYCQICHGDSGRGDGFNAAMLNPPPRNFTDENSWNQTDDRQFFAAISNGGQAVGKSVLMPAWGRTLSDQQIRDVIAYLRTVPQRAKHTETDAAAPTQ
jgi:cytochrome c oxidase cbb3-type subunit III